ncbi:hypothetical protein Mapa_013543 [Marchantia paleacea]|nr:hypothetical protein Mapa_013543 [Marchantia paleacea]
MKDATIPASPAALISFSSFLNSPRARSKRVTTTDSKREVRQTFVRRVANHIVKEKMVQPSNQRPKASWNSLSVPLASNAALTPKAGI